MGPYDLLVTVSPAADAHFFYTMQPHPPFQLLAASNEFCLASTQDPTDCESVQFISGASLSPPEPQWRRQHAAGGGAASDADYILAAETLLLTYGVNDCEAKIARLRMERVWSMLQPLHPGGAVCV